MNKKRFFYKLMFFSCMLLSIISVSYAAVSFDCAEAFRRVRVQNPDVVFSDYYAVGNRTDGGYDYVFVVSSAYSSDAFFCIVEEPSRVFMNGLQHEGVKGRAAYISSDCTVSYVDLSFSRNIVQNADGSFGSFTTCMGSLYDTCYGPVDIADTNIPIFLSEDGAKAFYLDGDTSGLKNSDKLGPQYSSDVELPQNLSVSWRPGEKYNSVDISWEQSEKTELTGYKTEIYRECSMKSEGLFVNNEFIALPRKKLFEIDTKSTNVQRLNLSDEMSDDYKLLQEYTDSIYMFSSSHYESYTLYIRNVCGNKCSNFVRVVLRQDGAGLIEVFTGDTNKHISVGAGSYSEVDSSNNVVDDSVYSPNYVGNDSDIDYGGNFLGYLKNGFGLLGDNGLLSLFSAVFFYIPSWLWTLIGSGIAAVIFVTVFNVVRGR